MAENIENNGCSQRDSAEHEGYAIAYYLKRHLAPPFNYQLFT